MATFDIRSSGPVDFSAVETPVPGFRIIGDAEATGTFVGEGGARFKADEFAQPDYASGMNHVDGQARLELANGEEVHIHYFGDTPVPDQTTGEMNEDLEFSIIGGTGQFDGASGGGRLTTHGNINDRPCIVASHLLGTIELV